MAIYDVFGPPCIFQTDNGKEFTAEVLQSAFKERWPGIQLLNGRARHPQSQGSVERANAVVEEYIRLLLRSQPGMPWADPFVLKSIAWAMNTTFSEPLQMTPYKCLFGYAPRLEEQAAGMCLDKAQAVAAEFMREGLDAGSAEEAGEDTGAAGSAEEAREDTAAAGSAEEAREDTAAAGSAEEAREDTAAAGSAEEAREPTAGPGFPTREKCLEAVGGITCDTGLQFDRTDVNVHICLWENEDGDLQYYPCTIVGFADGEHTLTYWKDSKDSRGSVQWTGSLIDEAYTVFRLPVQSTGETPERHKRTRAAARSANDSNRVKIAKVCHQGAQKKDYKLGDLVGVHVPTFDTNGLDEKFVLLFVICLVRTSTECGQILVC
ncbi:hypothetical protein CYMTET_13773 [Cymbomonas tetramitiformis]|uniref:Integrase catalytic domain-containing protein n=1 Tax=Cymbomonas tetramitiformis TaxID=36881 RepID=A0AAE0FQT6_9CHLO|nr:hypothetical protein CYMTET_27067 [Cymbomonas tetramitiformis]KAK3278278.1 hypothetical protein CYMTET_13773 [Cymbomonas tetramitiformis]